MDERAREEESGTEFVDEIAGDPGAARWFWRIVGCKSLIQSADGKGSGLPNVMRTVSGGW